MARTPTGELSTWLLAAVHGGYSGEGHRSGLFNAPSSVHDDPDSYQFHMEESGDVVAGVFEKCARSPSSAGPRQSPGARLLKIAWDVEDDVFQAAETALFSGLGEHGEPRQGQSAPGDDDLFCLECRYQPSQCQLHQELQI
jgi:hypothetical protein